jgi:hypothetical protein
MRRKGRSSAMAEGSRHRAWIYCLRMISAQTRSAFAARENRCTPFRITRQGSAQAADAPRCAAASVTARSPKQQAPREATAASGATTAPATAAAKCSAAMKSTAATESSATTPVASATAMASAATAAAAARQLHHAGRAVFPVEEVECRKTDVGHFFFAEDEALIGRDIEGQRIVSGRKSGCGCASHQRKAQPSGTQCGHGDDLGPTFPLRSLLHPGHTAILHASVQLSAEKILR